MVSHSAVSMKVLVFSEEYPPERGGVAISTHRIVSGLHEAGVELAVVCYDSSSSPADVPHVCSTAESEGLWLHRVGPYFRHRAEEVSEEEKAAMRRNAFLQGRRLAERSPGHRFRRLGEIEEGARRLAGRARGGPDDLASSCHHRRLHRRAGQSSVRGAR